MKSRMKMSNMKVDINCFPFALSDRLSAAFPGELLRNTGFRPVQWRLAARSASVLAL